MMRRTLVMLLSISCLVEVVPGQRASRSPQTDGAHPPVAAGDESGCITCHREVTTHRVMHGPTAAGKCFTCHVPIETGRPQIMKLTHEARAGETSRLCLACHEEIGSRMRDARVHAPAASGDCVACHDPHGGAFRFQLSADGNGACVSCHVDIAQALAQPFTHAPARASCVICHDAHAGKHPSQLRAPLNTVCLACHFDTPAERTSADSAALFGTALTRHTDLLTAGPRIALDRSRRSGHPNIGHPVEGPDDPRRKGRALDCASCHNPHGASSRSLLRFEASGVSSLCIGCHPF
jgi:predicted CXXCH cytochrome family protein